MTELDFESAQLQLLTDALRAGPGSPQWRDALASLDERVSGVDEYKLLYTARERLASGRAYREVRAGQGFTRKVFDAIEQEESAAPATLPSANVIAAISALVILGVLALVAFFVIPRAGSELPQDLSQTYFVTTRAETSFGSELGMEWISFGPMPVVARDGLRPARIEDGGPTGEGFRGGGVRYERSFAPGEPFAAVATIRHLKAADDLVVQLFVADDPNLSGDTATSPHELVWSLRGGEASVVLPDGSVEVQDVAVRAGPGTDVEVRIAVNKSEAAVDMNGKRLWTGGSKLDTTQSRIAGVRFLTRGGAGDGKDRAVIESVKILVPQKP